MDDLTLGIWNAWIFMSVFLIQMLVIMFVDKRIREKSHVPAQARQSWKARSAGIIGNLVWLLALIYSIFLPFKFSTLWYCIGLSVFIVGLIVMTVATFNFITTPAEMLIKKGIYRFSRHPMYLATFLICMGSGIAAASWLFILFSVIMILCFYQEALIEEKYCLEIYGTAYRDYMENVPRWFGLYRQ